MHACVQGGRLHVLPAVKQGHALTVTFQLPSLLREYAAKAEDYVSHLVGHEGSGSLLSALKAKGCARRAPPSLGMLFTCRTSGQTLVQTPVGWRRQEVR